MRERLPGAEAPSKVRPARRSSARSPAPRGSSARPAPRPALLSPPSGTPARRSAPTRYRGSAAPRRRRLRSPAPAGSARLLPETPLPWRALRVLARHRAEDLIGPAGGWGWGQVPSELIGAGPRPGRMPHRRGCGPEGEGAGRGNTAQAVLSSAASLSCAACLPEKRELGSRAP